MATPYADVVRSLTEFGAMIAPFNQSTMRAPTGITQVAGRSLANGYCAGVALDWIRRALLGSGTTKSLGYQTGDHAGSPGRSNKAARQYANVERMATAYAQGTGKTFVDASTPSMVLTELRRLLSEQAGAGPLTWNNSRTFDEPVKIPQKTVQGLMGLYKLTGPPFELTGIYTYEYLERTYAGQLVGMLETRTLGTETVWADFARQMDEMFAQQRTLQGRNMTSKPYSSLSVFKTSAAKNYATGGHWLNDVTTNGVRPGCATYVAFELRLANGTTSGHAVAIHQLRADKFHFLDPNYGVFDYSAQGLNNALQHLFWANYHNNANPPIYGEDGDQVTNCVSYFVFGPARSANPFA